MAAHGGAFRFDTRWIVPVINDSDLIRVAAVLFWWNLKKAPTTRAPQWVAIVIAVAALGASSGTMVQAILIGHSGATAVWSEDMGVPAS